MKCVQCRRPYMVQNNGTCLACELHISERLHTATFTQSRYRKAKWMDALAVALLMALMMALGVIAWASTAKADGYIDEDELVYSELHRQTICDVVTDYYGLSGVLGVHQAIMDDGFTADSAVDILNFSVHEYCPENWRLLVAIGKQFRTAS